MSNHQFDDDTRADEAMNLLREADPASPAAAEARGEMLLARVMSARSPSRATRLMPMAAGGAAGVVAIGVVTAAIIAFNGEGSSNQPAEPVDSSDTDRGGGFAALCVELYSPEGLKNREWAFDGVVESIDMETFSATFAVNRVLSGELGETITLQAGPLLGVTSVGDGTALVEGERYLVSGDDDFAWGCGFSVAHSDEAAAEWEAALAN